MPIDTFGHSYPVPEVKHRQVSMTECRCGEVFASALALDTHILGPEPAFAHHRDLAAAIEAIQVRAKEMAKEGSDGNV